MVVKAMRATIDIREPTQNTCWSGVCMVLTMTSIDGWDPDAWGGGNVVTSTQKVVYLISAIILGTPIELLFAHV